MNNISKYTTYYSDRGLPLVYMGKSDTPVLTVENYLKWYSLYLVDPGGIVSVVDFPDEFCDHVPKPLAVMSLCEENMWYMHDQSFEMIVGRWILEVENRGILTL